MKRMWMTMVCAAMALSMTSMALAQEAGPKGGGPGEGRRGPGGAQAMLKMEDEILAKLNLTPAQKKQVDTLRKERQAALEGLKNAAPEERREKMQAATKAYREGLMKVLTPAQQEEYKKLMKEMREKAQQNRPKRKGAPGAGE